MTAILTLPGTFRHQETNGAELGDAAAQQSANFVVEGALRSRYPLIAEAALRNRSSSFVIDGEAMPSGRRASNRARLALRMVSGSLRRSSLSSARTSKA